MIKFCKFHGFGNDYLVVMQEDLRAVESLETFARAVCDRHRGAGADGVAVVEKIADETADFAVRIINPDGSEAGFSGNGTRCAAAHLYRSKLWNGEDLRLRLASGVKKYHLLEAETNENFVFAAEIGAPKFDSLSIPMFLSRNRNDVVDFPLEIAGEHILISAVNVGNPVACVFLEDFEQFDWRKIGAAIETRATFPERTNVVFVKVLDQENIEIRIWERGAGETSSSGTCSAAAAIISAYSGKTNRKVAVRAVGGTTIVEWREQDDEILLTGSAEFVFCGEWSKAVRV